MIIVNHQLKVTRFTPTVRQFFQLSISDYGHVITTLPTTADFPDLRRTLQTVIDTAEAIEHEFDMDLGRYLLRITPYLGEFAQPMGAMLTFVDLSHLLRTEKALEESNATLKAILGHVVDGIVVANEKGIIESINAAAEKIFGYSEEEAVGQNVNLLQPEPYRSKHDQYIQNYLETGRAKIIGLSREVSGRDVQEDMTQAQ